MNAETRPFINQPSLPTAQLWSALLTIHNHLLVNKLCRFPSEISEKPVPPNVVDAIRLLDCWLDVAIENDWLAQGKSED